MSKTNEVLFKCVVPGRPMVKKNGAKVYGNRYVTSAPYRNWERSAEIYVKNAMNMHSANLFPIEGELRMEAIFYFENRKSEADLSALLEGIQDVLQKMGVIVNDKNIVLLDGSTKLFGHTPSLEVRLYRV